MQEGMGTWTRGSALLDLQYLDRQHQDDQWLKLQPFKSQDQEILIICSIYIPKTTILPCVLDCSIVQYQHTQVH